jgi:Protein of unknown function (DUF2934)
MGIPGRMSISPRERSSDRWKNAETRCLKNVLDRNKTQLYKDFRFLGEERDSMQGTEMNRDEEIRQVAYKLWQEEGYPHGYEVQHWLKAETIWLEEHRPKNKPEQSKPLKRTKSRKTADAEREL